MISVPWLHLLSPDLPSRLGYIRHALFDFDGTLSVLREGWEQVMAPLMVEQICGQKLPTPEIQAEVQAYIDRSTGILTIEQMRWLEDEVDRYGLNQDHRTPAQYKTLYLDRLMQTVQQRITSVRRGESNPDEMMVSGSRLFLAGLQQRGVVLYLASGSDHAGVLDEAGVLGILDFFNGGIYGALDDSDVNDKGRIIGRILAEHHLGGESLLVVGDGPVELRQAKAAGALALGVASDEIRRIGWNEQKIRRLQAAGADALIPDFSHAAELAGFFVF